MRQEGVERRQFALTAYNNLLLPVRFEDGPRLYASFEDNLPSVAGCPTRLNATIWLEPGSACVAGGGGERALTIPEHFYKDWGSGQPIVFSHGWPLSADDWDAQMLFFLQRGYRVIAHDRRGHGRSEQVSEGNDMDHYADDLAELTERLDLHDAIHVGHSAGGGEVARYVGRHGESRVAKVTLISGVTPSVLQTDANQVGVPQEAFEGLQAQLAANRSEFYRTVPSGPFYNFDQTGVEPSEAVIANWWRQGTMGSAKGQYECVSEFIRQDYSDDLKKISVPVLALNGEADQIVPCATSGPRAVELVQNGPLKTYAGFPHGMPTTHADTINADLLTFIQS